MKFEKIIKLEGKAARFSESCRGLGRRFLSLILVQINTSFPRPFPNPRRLTEQTSPFDLNLTPDYKIFAIILQKTRHIAKHCSNIFRAIECIEQTN